MAIDEARRKLLWGSGMEYARKVDRYWILKTLLVGFVYWLILGIQASFRIQTLVVPSILLGLFLTYAIGLYLFIEIRGLNGRLSENRLRLKALLLQNYNSFVLVWMSIGSLAAARGFILSFPRLQHALSTALLVTYAISFGLASLWAPRSIPNSSQGLEEAQRGDAKVMPYLIGCQGSVVGIGAFLSAWLLHDSSAWGSILAASLFSVLALFLCVFGVLGLYRFILMARSL